MAFKPCSEIIERKKSLKVQINIAKQCFPDDHSLQLGFSREKWHCAPNIIQGFTMQALLLEIENLYEEVESFMDEIINSYRSSERHGPEKQSYKPYDEGYNGFLCLYKVISSSLGIRFCVVEHIIPAVLNCTLLR